MTYYERNKEKIKARIAEKKAEDPEKFKAYKTKWRDNNKEYAKEYYEKNKEKIKAQALAYYYKETEKKAEEPVIDG
jgi:type I site-specific restriction-modification system R (restriction) subunit